MENEQTTGQVKRVPNPTGKGGFGDHPENRSPGGWDRNNSFSYWLNYFKSLTVKDFKKYKKEHEEEMTMSALGAYERIDKMIEDVGQFVLVANRTEGYPKESLRIDAESMPIALVEFIGQKNGKDKDKVS